MQRDRLRTPWDRVQAHHVHALADGGGPEGRGVPLAIATTERLTTSAYGATMLAEH